MAETTIVPFASLPACAASCGPLYDVNGACVPPVVSSTTVAAYQQCFCSDVRLTAFSSATAGVCDNACTADPSGLGSLTSWYQSMCKSVQALQADATTSSSGSSGTGSSKASSGGGGGWLSSHWQWVIFIVVMVVGIAGIWTGAAIWRKRYLRKRDRQKDPQYALGQRPGGGSTPTQQMRSSASMMRSYPPAPGSFMPGSGDGGYSEKPRKKKWGFM